MTISAADVRAIARLARLELTDAEVERFRGELAAILGYIDRLAEVETAAGEGASADPDHPLREDVARPWPDPGALHAEAPDFAGGHYRVPRVIE